MRNLRSLAIWILLLAGSTTYAVAPTAESLVEEYLSVLGAPGSNTATADRITRFTKLLKAYATRVQNSGTISSRDLPLYFSELDDLYPNSTGPVAESGFRLVQWAAKHPSGDDERLDYARVTLYAALALAAGGETNRMIADQVTKYNGGDVRFFTEATHAAATRNGVFYRPAPTNSSYVYPLESNKAGNSSIITIGIISDWATGMPQEFDLLDKMVKGFSPDVVMHLGDVYYSGTSEDQIEHQYKPVREFLNNGTQFYTIPGNHDYYSGNQPFLDMIDQLRADGVTKQESSYFALEGESWVMINMDTGRSDHDPLHSPVLLSFLPEEQAQWVHHQVETAKAKHKRIIFTSHHQLFSSKESVGNLNGVPQAVNKNLLDQIGPAIEDVELWFWGHEHTLLAFEPYVGLKRGRMVGNGGIPTFASSQPYAPNAALTLPEGETQLPRAKAGTAQSKVASFGYYLRHAFTIITLDGVRARVDYYELDWDCQISLGCVWGEPTLVMSETL